MIITDSLGQPRQQDNIPLLFEDTWPHLVSSYIVKKKSNYIPILAAYSFDTNKLVNNIAYYKLFQPQVIIIQLGIVDCPRRAISRKMLNIIRQIPVIRNIVKKITNKFHFQLTKLYNITYTSKFRYRDNLQKFINNFSNTKIFIIPILPVGKTMKNKSYRIENQIRLYNKLLYEIEKNNSNTFFLENIFNEFINEIDSLTYSDGFHLNKKGQELLYSLVIKGLLDNDS